MCACAPASDTVSTEPECLDAPGPLQCEPLYGLTPEGEVQPTFADMLKNTFKPTCGSNRACHQSDGAKGGLVLDDEATAHTALLDKGSDGRLRVRPGDLRCGKLIVRLETPDKAWSMPPGKPVDEATLCVIRHWINNGAPR